MNSPILILFFNRLMHRAMYPCFIRPSRNKDDFLLEDALNNQMNRLSATFLAFWNDTMVGYFH
jgi:hypothetical protein